MSGQLPTSPGFTTTNLKSVTQTLSSESQSGKQQIRSFGGHRWQFRAKYPPLTRSEFMPVWAFLLSQKGKFDSFAVIPPDLAVPLGVASGTPLVVGGGQSGNTLNIDGGGASTTGWLKAGDIFTVAGSTKVHMLTQDANTGAGGAVTLNFEPDLIVSPADNGLLKINNVAFTMRLKNDVQSYQARKKPFYNYDLDLIEAL